MQQAELLLLSTRFDAQPVLKAICSGHIQYSVPGGYRDSGRSEGSHSVITVRYLAEYGSFHDQ